MTEQSTDTLDVGSVIADTYRIVGILGRGGMGTVWEAHHQRLPGKRVAVKVLHSVVASDFESLTRFRREAEIACRLGHPNIVEVHDFNKLPDGTPYLILELLEGESLDARLRDGPLSLESCQRILRQIGGALECAHAQDVIHRDLKPQNIFLVPASSEEGHETAKVLDFGISKIRGSETVKTQQSTLLGTPQYMAPEQANGDHENVDARTDLFALAAMLYELLSGKPAFSGLTIPEVVYKVVHADPVDIRSLVPELPEQMAQAIHKALNKAQEDRYPSIAAFVEAFTGSPLPAVRAPRVSKPSPVAIAATLDSSKIELGDANTIDSQRLAAPPNLPPEFSGTGPTFDSRKLPIAATLDSSRLPIAVAVPVERAATEPAPTTESGPAQESGPQVVQEATLDIARESRDKHRARTAWTLAFGLALGLGVAALVLKPAATPPSPPTGQDVVQKSLELPHAQVPEPRHVASLPQTSDAAVEAAERPQVTADAALVIPDAGVTPDARVRPRRHSTKPVTLPVEPLNPKVVALLSKARSQLKAGSYKAAIMSAKNALKKQHQEESYYIQVQAYCHLQDLANAKPALRNIKTGKKRKSVQRYCANAGQTLR